MKKLLICLLCALLLAGCAAKPSLPEKTEPAAEPVITAVPVTAPAETEPVTAETPETFPSESAAAETEPPAAEVPETEPAFTEAPETEPVETETPETEPVETEPPEPLFTEINHYTVGPSYTIYASRQAMDAYPAFADALLFERPEVIELTESYDDNLTLWSIFSQSPYGFLIEDDTFVNDHTASRVTYAFSAEEQAARIAFIDGEYLELLNDCIRDGMSDTEKLLSLYHYFGTRIHYDYSWVEAKNAADDQRNYPDIVIYDALMTGYGVCHTYTYLMEYALQQVGIPCYRIFGDMAYGDDSHMWLIAETGGELYHFDVTWDSNGDGSVGLRSFGMTDEERLAGGVSENYRICIDVALNGLPCTSERFASLRDVTDFRLNFDGTVDVQRNWEDEWETVPIP